MAIVLALLIVGWLLAFALGAQAGFESQPTAKVAPVTKNRAPEAVATSYQKTASAS